MKYSGTNLEKKFDLFSEHWRPRIIGELNDYQIKLAKIQGEFVWHKHDDTDELFVCVEGELQIEFRDGSVTLRTGELYVVPRGVEHKPSAREECRIMLIEPKGVVNTGDVGGELTAP
ncbi:MAG: cupin domain-containing protein, partial [Gammaproteobacteria bacterium]